MIRRLKPITLIVSILLGAVTLLSWTMTWFVVQLDDPDGAGQAIPVTGEVAAPALAALGLAGLALVAALAIAGPVFRSVLGLLQVAIAASIGLSAWGAIANPVASSTPLVTQTTGISGGQSVEALVAAVSATPWPAVTMVISALMALTGALIVATSRRWPTATNKYQAVRFDEADAPRSAVSDWDSLSDGSDPTSR